MSKHASRFVWYELTTNDAAAAKAFYTAVVGWTAEDQPMPGGSGTYTLLKVDGRQVAGLLVLPPQAPGASMPPMWTGYVAVDDVDASARKAAELGGSIFKPADDIPGVGRFAIVGDPFGAGLALFKPVDGEEMFEIPPMGAPGYIAWHELFAGDREKAFAFYEAMFGWRKVRAVDTPMGPYQIYGTADVDLGGMMTKPEQMPYSAWVYYFTVPDIDAGAAKVTAAGGKVLMGPMEVPGGAWVLQAQDPQGAHFALLGEKS